MTYCLREGNGELAQVILNDSTAATVVTMTFTYDDIEVTSPWSGLQVLEVDSRAALRLVALIDRAEE